MMAYRFLAGDGKPLQLDPSVAGLHTKLLHCLDCHTVVAELDQGSAIFPILESEL
jgi:hypothetical protein